MLNPLRYGSFAIQLISHKLLRWLVPFFILVALVSNAFLLAEGLLYKELFAVHLAVYGIATLGYFFPEWQRLNLIRIVYFFVMVNLAIAIAWYKYLVGERYILWEPSKR
jgi:hypothetical protein